jgi:2-polyprenyl-3-methyl-5-hydroxy-6-metoxy-1,4-benzoquinol methylase
MVGWTISLWLDYVTGKFLRRLFQNPKRILRDYVKPGMTVLDVGAGKGYFSVGMAKMVGSNGRIVAVDLEAHEIESLKKRAARAGVSERIDARVCDERSLAIDELAGRVDFALAYYVVHHAPDVDALMAEVHKALKPGGKFLIAEPSHHASAEYCAATEAAAEQAGFVPSDHPKLTRDWAVLFLKN